MAAAANASPIAPRRRAKPAQEARAQRVTARERLRRVIEYRRKLEARRPR